MSDKEDLAEGCLKLFVAIGLSFFAPVVLRDLWNWFAVPQFEMKAMGYWMAFGLNALRTLLTYRYTEKNDKWDPFVIGFGLYLICWGFGALAHGGL